MKKTVRDNYRVVVEPRDPGNYGAFYIGGTTRPEAQTVSLCEEIKDQIKRHIDDVESISIECDTSDVCGFCGYDWEVDEVDGCPLCCQLAIEEFEGGSNHEARTY